MVSSYRPRPEEAAPQVHAARGPRTGSTASRRMHQAHPAARVPRDLLDPVVGYFKPQRIILFGSRARGEATRDSDIDLLVVVDDDTPPEKLHWQDGFGAYRSKCDADIFPMRAEDFERERAIANTLAVEADTDGSSFMARERIMHESAGLTRPMGSGQSLA